jgi:hypothetical protein
LVRTWRSDSFKSYISDFWNILDLIRLTLAWTWINLNDDPVFGFNDGKDFLTNDENHSNTEEYEKE